VQATLTSIWGGLDRRRLEPERMDDPGLEGGAHRAALAGLARLNAWSLSDRALFRPVSRLAAELGRPVRVLDLACGAGDQGLRLVRRARRHGIELRLDGCDRSLVALEVAAERARELGIEARFFRRDVVAEGVPEGYDVVLCTLFLHHLGEADASGLLAATERAQPRLAVIQDLRRERAGAALAWLASRTLTRSAVVRDDALLSVAAAFDAGEVERLALHAELPHVHVERIWPWRWQLAWRPRRDRQRALSARLRAAVPRELASSAAGDARQVGLDLVPRGQ
jgi:SAM-dependent methyltransferase